MFIRIDDLRIHDLFGIVDNLGVDVWIRRSFTDRCISRIIAVERIIAPRHWRKVKIIKTKTEIDSISDDYAMFNVETNSYNGASRDKFR